MASTIRPPRRRSDAPRAAVVRDLSAGIPTQRDQTIALTVLPPTPTYLALLRWCDRVAGPGAAPSPQDVLGALLARLLVDKELAANLAADLREGAGADEIENYAGW